MKCPICNEPLVIADSDFEFVNDDNPETPTELYSVLKMVCINNRVDSIKHQMVCSNYCGPDLKNPLKVVEIVRNRVK